MRSFKFGEELCTQNPDGTWSTGDKVLDFTFNSMARSFMDNCSAADGDPVAFAFHKMVELHKGTDVVDDLKVSTIDGATY